MSLRLEMIQVARLAPRQLGEAAEIVAAFLHDELNQDGGARDRAGQSDLYYTSFLLDALLALRAEPPAGRVRRYLEGFGDGAGLDLVHGACLVRAWRSLGADLPRGLADRLCADLEARRAADGGYGTEAGAREGSLYNAFLAVGTYLDLGRRVPGPDRIAASLARLRCPDGGFADDARLPVGTTPTTAAAVTLLRQLGREVPARARDWLLGRLHPSGGFLAMPAAPIPDLLSTATALHALASLGVSLEPLRERCLDFLDSLWTGRSFVANWEEDETDCEYAFYALLALGHLSA